MFQSRTANSLAHLERGDVSLMKTLVPTCYYLLTLLASALAIPNSAWAQGDDGVEARFIAMLTNATLKGSWAPVAGGQLGKEKGDDSYQIARVEKGDGDQWKVVSVVNFQGREMQFPIPCSVKFAGDTTVLILDNVRASP